MGRRKEDTLSVLKKDRTLSKLEFYRNANKLRRQILFLMARDFGIKSRIRAPTFYTKKWEADDIKTFTEILDKYGINKCVDEFPLWMIEEERKNFNLLIRSMMIHITRSYTIWATTRAEADLRRNSQDLAIADCESLKQELELIVDIFPVKAEKLVHYVEAIDTEIALLKGWRKSDNKRFKELK